ncbi:uncharacterized protein LOC129753825 [Uranotaenia lowii]|uniref:uncharacterized protein LOC129753825 n=1 Tax=Uranotaenia lowii TaxID=190385 RepID=UPI00247AB073|nr:uncharacterized protein LOC129753825 [Uranotaenia lowii]
MCRDDKDGGILTDLNSLGDQKDLPLTTVSPNELPALQPSLEEARSSSGPGDGFEGRKRRRLGRKRKRRPLHDGYWQGDAGKEDEPAEAYYRDPEVSSQAPIGPRKRDRGQSRWEGIRDSSAYRNRQDPWANPYSDAIDPSVPSIVGNRNAPLRPSQESSGSRGRESFPPIESNRQRKVHSREETTTQSSGYKSYRRPYSQAKRIEEESASSSADSGRSSAAELKNLLKQSGGLSLSEILQQRNISLQDLLKGKQMALAALTQNPLDATTVTESENEVASIIPTVPSIKPRIPEEPTRRTDFQEAKSMKRIPVFSPSANPVVATEAPVASTAIASSEISPSGPDGINSVDDIITIDNLGDRNDNVAIFPTVEIKQLALNPVLPTVKEERLRPIKGIASRIRPDLSNSNIRTEEIFNSPKKRPEFPRSSIPESWATSTTTSTTAASNREKWTPSPGLNEKREQFLAKLAQSKSRNRLSSTASTEFSSSSPEEEPSEPEPSLQSIISEPLLMRIPTTPRNRIAIRPKFRTNDYTSSTQAPEPTKENPFLADIEFHDEAENVTKLLEAEEPELNIIEKFTSFEDTKPANDPSASLYPASDQTTEQQQFETISEDDLIERINQNTQRSFTDSFEELLRDVTESNPSLFNDLHPITLSDDRAEILELMEDRRIGSRLAKVLSQRNMTLDQLLEHRKRGSSQLHLSEMINGKPKPLDGKMDIVTAFEHFPRFNIGNLRSIRPDDIKMDSQGFSYFTSIINIRPTDEAFKEGRSMQEKANNRHYKLPDWRLPGHATHRQSSEVHFLANGGHSRGGLIVPSRMSADAEFDSSRDDSQPRDLLDLELSGHGYGHHRHAVTIESTSIPLGVRSAIVASACIVGVSLTIFALIFSICRWRQRRRNKLNYTENFNMAKGRLPSIIHGVAEGLKTSSSHDQPAPSVYTVQQTLQRKESRAHMMDPNSQQVQDYLWDNRRKPFQ